MATRNPNFFANLKPNRSGYGPLNASLGSKLASLFPPGPGDDEPVVEGQKQAPGGMHPSLRAKLMRDEEFLHGRSPASQASKPMLSLGTPPAADLRPEALLASDPETKQRRLRELQEGVVRRYRTNLPLLSLQRLSEPSEKELLSTDPVSFFRTHGELLSTAEKKAPGGLFANPDKTMIDAISEARQIIDSMEPGNTIQPKTPLQYLATSLPGAITEEEKRTLNMPTAQRAFDPNMGPLTPSQERGEQPEPLVPPLAPEEAARQRGLIEQAASPEYVARMKELSSSAAEDILRNSGGKIGTRDEARKALMGAFNGTPEMDAAIERVERELARVRSERKKPSALEFMAMALMNFSGMNPRVTADMVLGLGEQQRKESELERFIMGLERDRAVSGMQGRRTAAQLEAQQGALDRRLEQRDMELMNRMNESQMERAQKEEESKRSLLRSLAGQESNIEGASLDQATREKARASRQLLKQALGIDDSGLDEIIRQQRLMQQPKTPPKDERQSRTFGSALAGGDFA